MVKTVVALIAPPQCVGCGQEGSALCGDCRSRALPHPPTCWNCNRLSSDWRTCPRCRRTFALHGVVVGARYDGVIKDLIWALKFGRNHAAAEAAAKIIIPFLHSDFDAVTSVPSSPSRRRQRGYNQSALLGKAVARQLGLPYRELLGRFHQAEQIGASREERFRQVTGAFYAKNRLPRRVLIVDDVLTTGATLNACSRALRDGGVSEVWAAAVAKH